MQVRRTRAPIFCPRQELPSKANMMNARTSATMLRHAGIGQRPVRERNPDLRLDAASIKKALDARLEASPERYQRGKVLEVAVVMIGGW
jgi:hypothetical protein